MQGPGMMGLYMICSCSSICNCSPAIGSTHSTVNYVLHISRMPLCSSHAHIVYEFATVAHCQDFSYIAALLQGQALWAAA